jgi:hypothetical protein
MDPELTPAVRRHFGVTFDPCDGPRDRFVTGGRAWLGMRSGRIDPAICGLSTIGLADEWWVTGNVVRDLAALNKREMLPWDHWGMAREARVGNGLTETALARVDAVALLTAAAEGNWTAIRETYERDDGFRVPRVVMNFPKGVPVEVDLGA